MPIQLAAIGGTPPYTWSATVNPFNGLTLSTAGLITGTATSTFNGTWQIIVTDSVSNTATFDLRVVISPSPVVTPIFNPIFNSVVSIGLNPDLDLPFMSFTYINLSPTDELDPTITSIYLDVHHTVEVGSGGGGGS